MRPSPDPTFLSSSSPPTSHGPEPGTLSESPATVTLAPAGAGASYSGSFTLTASGGSVAFGVTVPAGEPYLSVSPARGRLPAGQTVTVTVTLTPYPAGPAPVYDSTLTVSPGSIPVTVLYPPAG